MPLPTIPSGNVASAISGAYEVANSCRFDGSSAYLSRTLSTPTNASKFTYSCWVKRSDLTTGIFLFANGGDIQNFANIAFNAEYFFWHILDSNSEVSKLRTTAKYRDVSAWYNLVFVWDSTQSTATDRTKMYVNGTRITSFGQQTNSGQNVNYDMNTAVEHMIGAEKGNTGGSVGNYFNGYMAEVAFVDGQALDPTSFGEYDEDSPQIWKPKDISSGITWGNNGFYLDFEDSSALGNDVTGNNNDFSTSGLAATDQTTDTPTNNFATLNPLNVPTSNAPTFKEGNLETESATTSGQRFMGSSTIGVTAGKWYAECKIVVIDSATVGVSPDVAVHAKDSTYIGSHAHDWSILPDSGNKYADNNGTTHGDAFSTNDILMIALDLVNNNVYFGRNGNWFDGSGNADEAAPNSALSLTAPASTPEQAYFFACSDGGGSAKAKVQWNFGNPPFSISSGNADANGYGAFEYAPPSGYLALCTKNLGSDGG